MTQMLGDKPPKGTMFVVCFILLFGLLLCYGIWQGVTVTTPYFNNLRASEYQNFKVMLSKDSPMDYFTYNGMVDGSGVIGLKDNGPYPDIINTVYVNVGSVFFRGSAKYQVIELTPDYGVFRRVVVL